MTAQIAATVHGREAALDEEFAHRLGLVETVFQQQPATGQQMRRRLLDDHADIVQAIDAPPTSALLGSKRTSPWLRCGSAAADRKSVV